MGEREEEDRNGREMMERETLVGEREIGIGQRERERDRDGGERERERERESEDTGVG